MTMKKINDTCFFKNLARAVTLSILNAPEKSKAVAGIESVIMNYFDETTTVYGTAEIIEKMNNELERYYSAKEKEGEK